MRALLDMRVGDALRRLAFAFLVGVILWMPVIVELLRTKP